jgi:putative protein-disulfide isomerase
MTKAITLLHFLMLAIICICNGQQKKSIMENNNNPLLCDSTDGVCEIPNAKTNTDSVYLAHQKKPIKIIYFTDPICSSCWGIEPQLRKLKLEYGNDIEIEYHMGGLLPNWNYNSGGISKPSDVAHHWDEVSKHYDMPIDGDVWLENPLHSSYPPSIAFKAAQMQDEKKAIHFMRNIREMVFLEKKNITAWQNISIAAIEAGLDTAKLKTDYESTAKDLFEADLALGKKLGVRGFPTLFFVDSLNNQQMVYGFKPYKAFEDAVLKTFPTAEKVNYDNTWTGLFKKYSTLTTREFTELANKTKAESEVLLQSLTNKEKIIKMITKNGAIWKIKK